jgi:hypothetical protein
MKEENKTIDIDINKIIDQLLSVRTAKPGKLVNLK